MVKKVGTDLGLRPRLPKKTIPHSGMRTDGTLDFAFVLSEHDKEDDDYRRLKSLVYYYEWIGRQQVNRQRDKIAKKFNLAYGVIDVEDYIPGQSEQQAELQILDGEKLDIDLKFYPIIPNIINSMVNELGKHHIQYSANAVNPEATNMILEERNEMLRQLLLQPLEQEFAENMSAQGVQEGTDIYQQQLSIFQQLPKVQKYMNKEFRLDLEKWANNQMYIDRKRFKIKDLEKLSFFNKLATDRPFIHINLMDDDYKPEVLDPRQTFWLKSPYLDDVCDGVMFGWFEYDSPINLITRFGSKLREEDIEKLEKLHLHLRSMLTIETPGQYQIETPGIIESAQNHLAFRELFDAPASDSKYRGEEYKERLLQVSNMYFQSPRKLGKLTIKSKGEEYSTIVDETYVPTYPAQYNTEIIKEKNEVTLVFGEHVEWFYINELWRCVKINLSSNPNPDYNDDIYITLEKFPVQFPTQTNLFGSGIPVFGGPVTNRYNDSVTIVDKCKPWQVLYNYIWNRNDQLMKKEIGRFFAMNQNVIPKEAMGEDWGPNNFIRWALAARDTGIAPIDPSILNTGTSNIGLTGGYGQLVDLTVTDEVIQKAKLSEYFKNECLLLVGLSPQFLGDMSPSETATGISQGINRSYGNIKYLYEEHFSVWEKAIGTMLEFAKYFAMQSDVVEQSFINDEGERQIFRMPTTDLPLSKFGIFVTSDMDESIILENIRQWAMKDNTVEASLLDKVSLLNAKSISGIYSQIKELQKDKELKEKQIREEEQRQQQQLIESNQKMLDTKLEEEARQKELDRQSNERIAQIRVVGQSQFSEGSGVEELIKLQEQQQKQQNYYSDLLNKAAEKQHQRQQFANDNALAEKELGSKEQLEKEKLQVEREKILAGLQKSQNDVKIAKVNK